MTKKYVIYGLGISGISAAKFFAKNNKEVIATDDNSQTVSLVKSKLEAEGFSNKIAFKTPDEIKYDSKTVIIFSPGIPLYFPKKHKILEIVETSKAQLCCDLEVFYQENSQNNFIGITGTNGKSTTTALTGFIFEELGIKSDIGGNIGLPCFDLAIDNSEISNYIFETSSYQLDLISKLHFNIAALLNITPDHIDRHGSMENYISTKKRIFKNQVPGDFSLIGIDNDNSRKVFFELKNNPNFQSNLITISTEEVQEAGVALIDGILFNNINNAKEKVELKSDFLKGKHNEQNIAFSFAITYCHLLQQNNPNISTKNIITAIKKFHGLEHRMQLVGEIDGINFINDSKATNAESTKNALKAYDNIFWILGGKAKEDGIEILQPFFNKIVKAYLIGEATEDFAKILEKNSVTFEKCGDLKMAFEKSVFDAKNNRLSEKNILLSPSCASFDQWKNFEERGQYFCKLFDELPKT